MHLVELVFFCLHQIVKHVDADKVGHFRVHFLSFEKLKGNVAVRRTFVAISAHLHVVEVDFALAHAGCEHDDLLYREHFRFWDPVELLMVALSFQIEFLTHRFVLCLLVLENLCHIRVTEQLTDLVLRHLLENGGQIDLLAGITGHSHFGGLLATIIFLRHWGLVWAIVYFLREKVLLVIVGHLAELMLAMKGLAHLAFLGLTVLSM